MTNDTPKAVIDAIRKLYKANSAARALFDLTAKRERDATETSLVRISSLLGVDRGEAVALARALETTGCGEFVVGRRGQKSRFRWAYSCISLGQAASGEDVILEDVQDPIPESEEEETEGRSDELGHARSDPATAIAKAKEMLSGVFGVPLTSIEITIKA
jgi:hypothetical protein